MVFFESHLSQNVKSCALSIILLNYNCGVTSYVLMMRNRVDAIGVDSYTIATMSLLLGLLFGQILFGIFGDTLGRKFSFFGSSSLMLTGSILGIFPGLFPLLNGSEATMIVSQPYSISLMACYICSYSVSRNYVCRSLVCVDLYWDWVRAECTL